MSLYEAAMKAFRSGDDARTRDLAEEMRQSGQDVDGLCMLARLELRAGNSARAREFATEARALAADEQSQRAPLHLQAAAARLGGDTDEARRLYLESIELNRRLDNAFVAGEQYNLGFLELSEGDLDRARELFDNALSEARMRGYDSLLPLVALGRGALAVEEGEAAAGVRLIAAAAASVERSGEVFDPDDQIEVDRALERAHEVLDAESFERAEKEGRRLTVEEALA